MTTYWIDNYKKYRGNNDFINGIIAGIKTFAVWENGTYRVGVLRRPLSEEIQEIKQTLNYKEIQ